MAKISYADYIKKLPTSVLVAEAIFSELYKIYPTDKLSRVCETTSGGTPLRSRIEFYNGNIPWLKSGELNDGLISYVEEYISELGLKNSSAKLHPKGTLLLAMYGATAGRVGILSLDSSTNQAVCALFPNEDFVSKSFLFWFLRQHRFKFIEISKGGAQPNISQKVINDTLIVLPPLVIQKQIVDVLEFIEKENKLNLDLIPNEFHSRIHSVFTIRDSVENTSSEITHQLDLIKNLRQAFLREAMQGVLVNNETSDHKTGADLLAEIQAEKAQLVKDKKIKKPKPLAPITEEEIPFVIPENWTWCRLGEISEITRGKGPKYSENGANLMLNQKCVRWFTIDPEYAKSIDIDWYNSLDELYKLKLNDILVNSTGEGTIGRSGMANENSVNYAYDSHTLKVRSFINQSFICSFINSKYGQKQVDDLKGAKSTKQTELGATNLNNFAIPLPPLEIQERIVDKLDELMDSCDALEEQVKQSQQTNELLLQQVLREALGGATPKQINAEVAELKQDAKEVTTENEFETHELSDIDLQIAAIAYMMESKLGLNYGNVAIQKTVFNTSYFNPNLLSKQYQFTNYNYGTFSQELASDLSKNSSLVSAKVGAKKEVLKVCDKKKKRVLDFLSAKENKRFVTQINNLLDIYKLPFINKETTKIELFNTVLKAHADTNSFDLEVIYEAMQQWPIKQEHYNTKAEKFSKEETKKMIDLIQRVIPSIEIGS